jgi:Na+/phosphate symporter
MKQQKPKLDQSMAIAELLRMQNKVINTLTKEKKYFEQKYKELNEEIKREEMILEQMKAQFRDYL